MKRLPRDQQKELADQARLLRAWKAWHREQLDEALAGPHGSTIAQLMLRLDQLELSSAAVLLDFMRRTDWNEVSCDARLIALHQINDAICRLRERNGMAPLDDPLPGQPDNVFRRVRQMLFAAPPGAHPGLNRMKQRDDKQVKYE
jgi:hypothetical protein